jgi:hypothetical protein
MRIISPYPMDWSSSPKRRPLYSQYQDDDPTRTMEFVILMQLIGRWIIQAHAEVDKLLYIYRTGLSRFRSKP